MSGGRDGLAGLCAADGEFMLLARHWTGVLRLGFGPGGAGQAADGAGGAHGTLDLRLEGGRPVEAADAPDGPLADEPGLVGLAAPAELWDRILAPVPAPFCNDVVPAQALGLVRSGHELTFWQYYPAIRRLVELLRTERAGATGAAGAATVGSGGR